MAKTKGKAKIAASNVSSRMEAISGNDMTAEAAASESVETNELATTMTLDKSEEEQKKEEICDGTEEVEKSEEIEDDLDESEEEHEVEENKDGLDQSEEVEGVEESEDGLDASEDMNKIEETMNAFEKSNEGDEVEEAKEDGKEEPVETIVPEGEKVEERDVIGELKDKDSGKGENVSDKKAKRMRKRKKKTAASAAASNDANKSSEGDKQGSSAAAKNDLKIQGKKAEGETKEDGKVEALGTDVPGGEKVEDRDVNGEVKDNGKGESVSNKKAKRMRVRKRKAAAGAAASNDANKSSEADKQGTSAAAKDLKMVDGMGLIFMCNAKTKKDCFRYKVFGLPESKKELVAKVYKGMRLFLFDIDLKLMYGIYKAASPGGYNIEPKAFKSAFPSQVRFTVLKDCLPLPEEKFKAAIKENYYGRNKFNCQLSPEQVKNLCKLFQTAVQPSKKKSGEAIISEQERSFSSRNRKRPRYEREVIRAEQERSPVSRGRKRSRHEREAIRSEQERISSSRGRKRPYRERARREDSIPRGRDVYARREAYASPPPRTLALPPPLPSVPYAYNPPADDHYYRREPPLHDLRDHRIVHVEARTHEPLEYRDPYSLYREPLSRETGYREPLPRESLYREAVYREPLPREAVYREPLSRDPLYSVPLSREAVYRESVPYTVAVNPTSLTPAAYDPPTTHYRY